MSIYVHQVCVAVQDKQRILEGCCQLVPSLKHAQVVADWAGLRPARDRVRLELDYHQVPYLHVNFLLSLCILAWHLVLDTLCSSPFCVLHCLSFPEEERRSADLHTDTACLVQSYLSRCTVASHRPV